MREIQKHELFKAQHGRCAACLMHRCVVPCEAADSEKIIGLICNPCKEIITLLPLESIKEEYAIGTEWEKVEGFGLYRTCTGKHVHDLTALRWIIEFLEATPPGAADDPTLYYQGESPPD